MRIRRSRLLTAVTFLVIAMALGSISVVAEEPPLGSELTLERAIALALERNLGYATAQLATRAAESAVREAQGDRSPQVSVGGEYDRQAFAREEGPGLTLTVEQTYPGLLPLVTLPGHPRPLSPVALAQLGEDQSRAKAEKERAGLVFNVTQAYYGVLKAARLREVQKAALTSAESARKVTVAKVNAGAATRVDQLRAEMDVAQAELSVAKAENAYTTAQTTLFSLLRMDPPVNPPAFAAVPPAEAPGSTLAALTEQALTKRAEVTEAALSLQQAVSRENQADFATLPAVTLTGSLAGERHAVSSSWNPVSGTVSWDALAGNHALVAAPKGAESSAWNLGVSVTYKLYDAGTLREAALQATLQTAQARNSLEQAKEAVASEVQDAWFGLAEARLSVEAMRKAERLSSESRRLTELRVQNGVGTPAELSEANADYLAAQVNLVQAEFTEQIAIAKVKKAGGVL